MKPRTSTLWAVAIGVWFAAFLVFALCVPIAHAEPTAPRAGDVTRVAIPNTPCSVGAYKPHAYGVAQVRGVGDIECGPTNYYDTLVVSAWVSVNRKVWTPPAPIAQCDFAHFCSVAKIKTKINGYACYYTGADAQVWENGQMIADLGPIYSGGLCTS